MTHRSSFSLASGLCFITLMGCGEGATSPTPADAEVAGHSGGTPPANAANGGGSGNPSSNGGAPAAASGTGGSAGTEGGGTPSGSAGALTGGSGGAVGTSGASGSGAAGSRAVDPGSEGDGEFQVGPDYPKSPDLTPKDVPQGRVFDFTLDSKNSQFFKGTDTTLLAKNQHTFTRAIKVYVPAKYKNGQAAPLFVIHDGPKQFDIAKIAVDNLSHETNAARQLPAFVIVSIANGGGDDKGSERGLEYDTMSDRYVRFVDEEVLPSVLANSAVKAAYPNLAFTQDPEGRATMGCSSGGAAAFTMGWFRPDLYRRIITYSGTFVDQQDDDAAEEAKYPLGAWEYHSGPSLIANSDKKPLRVFLSTNESDIGNAEAESTHHNWVMANQRMMKALAAKGYHYRYLFGKNAGHAPVKLQENTLPEALLWVWRGYPSD